MIDRRDLLVAATAMTAAASLPSSKSQAAVGDDSIPVRFALNTSTVRGQKLTIEQQVDVTAKAGYDGIEPWIRDIEKFVRAVLGVFVLVQFRLSLALENIQTGAGINGPGFFQDIVRLNGDGQGLACV